MEDASHTLKNHAKYDFKKRLIRSVSTGASATRSCSLSKRCSSRCQRAAVEEGLEDGLKSCLKDRLKSFKVRDEGEWRDSIWLSRTMASSVPLLSKANTLAPSIGTYGIP